MTGFGSFWVNRYLEDISESMPYSVDMDFKLFEFLGYALLVGGFLLLAFPKFLRIPEKNENKVYVGFKLFWILPVFWHLPCEEIRYMWKDSLQAKGKKHILVFAYSPNHNYLQKQFSDIARLENYEDAEEFETILSEYKIASNKSA